MVVSPGELKVANGKRERVSREGRRVGRRRGDPNTTMGHRRQREERRGQEEDEEERDCLGGVDWD